MCICRSAIPTIAFALARIINYDLTTTSRISRRDIDNYCSYIGAYLPGGTLNDKQSCYRHDERICDNPVGLSLARILIFRFRATVSLAKLLPKYHPSYLLRMHLSICIIYLCIFFILMDWPIFVCILIWMQIKRLRKNLQLSTRESEYVLIVFHVFVKIND